MNLLVIDYSITSDADLKVIAKKFGYDYDSMISQRDKFDFYKIFVDTDSDKLFAYIVNSDRSKIELSTVFDFVMNSIKPYVVEKPTVAIVLSVDAILDKISKFGIDSLVKEEKDFLDQSSKI